MSVQVRPVAPKFTRMILPKNFFYENILSITECGLIKKEFFETLKIADPGADTRSPNSFGFYDLKSTLCYVDRLTQLIEKDYGKVNFENSFTRLYQSGSSLLIHTDRDSLDVTLTINIAGIEDWDMHVSNINYSEELFDVDYQNNCSSYKTPKGSGMACLGRIFPHWRNELVCNDDEYVLQLFYHWNGVV